MWQVLPGQSLRHHSWHDEAVVYNDLSGDTHLLGEDALAVLLALQAEALDTAALCRALTLDADAFGAEIDAILHQLQAISLIGPVPC